MRWFRTGGWFGPLLLWAVCSTTGGVLPVGAQTPPPRSETESGDPTAEPTGWHRRFEADPQELLAPFDTDTRKDCRAILVHCVSEVFSHVYLQCPFLCGEYLREEGMKGTASDNPDALWEAGTLRAYNGDRIHAERFEGHVTVIATVPLLPGMMFYYYEMMETLHGKFAPAVEFVIIPIDHLEGLHIKLRKNPGVVVLEEESSIETHPWVRHLTSITPRSGAARRNHRDEIVQTDLHTDRINVFLVSSDGYFVERLVVPTMKTLQQRIALYLKSIDYEL